MCFSVGFWRDRLMEAYVAVKLPVLERRLIHRSLGSWHVSRFQVRNRDPVDRCIFLSGMYSFPRIYLYAHA